MPSRNISNILNGLSKHRGSKCPYASYAVNEDFSQVSVKSSVKSNVPIVYWTDIITPESLLNLYNEASRSSGVVSQKTCY